MAYCYSSNLLHFTPMELLQPVSSSWSITSSSAPPEDRRRSLPAESAKKNFNFEGLLKKSKGELSKILRTEAAVIAIEGKARSSKFNNLWPRAVLEALDNSIAGNRWESALKIFALLRKQNWYRPKGQTYARLLTMLGKCRQPEHASSLFRTMISEGFNPTLDVYTSLVGAFGYSGLFDEVMSIIDEMKAISDCKPDVFTYTILIGCCSKLRRFDLIPSLLAEMSYLGIESTSVTYNTLIDGYGKAGLVNEMENCLSLMLESGSCVPDIFTLNSILSAFGHRRRISEMEKRYIEFQHMGIDPDLTTFNILIKSYGKSGMYEKMIRILNFMKKRCFSPTTITFNTLIECFGKGGKIDEMEYYFRLMKMEGIKPNSITYCSLVSGFSKAGLVEKVPFLIREIENSDVFLDTPFFNSVINAYGEAGDIEIMKEMFLLMKEKKCDPDYVTFATMIKAYNSRSMDVDAQELELKLVELKSEIMLNGVMKQNHKIHAWRRG
ncbi:pentatricopeptide repeat-containing protein At3g53170 [Phalaenopsis equestris]|uniref:pentatricopeptide repeat-containing protein At3g53170 n=1 Tax=Phalaenopsis equestris TaxID=78828 RepID=UPI0009E5F067|nr:pentatricopeptide repeat-containing protein At3g53170 [Phalaenopsis equestris]XP_020575690.1 pentatricopeptide repeat-containing protein At3g53170 [Phalaenopsis equestris]XP_020575699.1 pentatricopeptide repeat-containing protein At3g53170 [Phalaenopsis equestris]